MDRVEVTNSGKPVKHGSASSYNNHGCRCVECTKAWADYMRDRMRNYRADKRKKKGKKNGVRVNL